MRLNDRLPVYLAALGVWLIIAVVGSFVVIQANTRLVALALLVFTVTLAATNIFHYSGWLAAMVSIVIFSLVEKNLNGINIGMVKSIGYFSVGVLITSGLISIITKELNGINSKINNNQKLIDELRLYDPITGLIRYHQALQLLKSEIIRSQRYKRNICLFLVQIENNEESKNQPFSEDPDGMKRQLAGALMSSVRASDIPFGGNEYGVVLPETNLDGAKIVVRRLTNTMVNKVHIPVSIGIAQYPEDGLTEVELLRAAEAAMQLALKNGKPFIQYNQIRNTISGHSTDVSKNNL